MPFRVKFENCGHFGSNFRIAVISGQYLGHSRSNVIILKKSTKFDCKTTANSISTYNSSEKSNSTDRTYSVSLNSNSKTKSEKSSQRSASKKSHYDTTVISKSLDRSQPVSNDSIKSSLKKSTSKVSEIVKVGKYIDKKVKKNPKLIFVKYLFLIEFNIINFSNKSIESSQNTSRDVSTHLSPSKIESDDYSENPRRVIILFSQQKKSKF